MNIPLRALIIADSDDDTAQLIHALSHGGFDPTYNRVETKEAMATVLDRRIWDLVICEYSLPRFNALSALNLLKERGLDFPFIVVSHSISEKAVVETIKAGAHDYIMMDNLARLIPSIKRELHEKAYRQEQKNTENVQLESGEKLSVIFDSFPDIIMILDAEIGQILSANKAVERLLGYESRSLVGRNFSTLFPFGCSQYADSLIRNIWIYGKVFEPQDFRHVDGSVHRLNINASLIPWNGDKVVLVILSDIPNRRDIGDEFIETILRYHRMLEAYPDPTLVCDMQGRVLGFNPSFTHVFSWELGELFEKNINYFIPEDNWPETKIMLNKALAGEKFSNIESRGFTKDKKIIPVSISGGPFRDRNGKTSGIIITLRDVREKMQIEDQLIQAQKMEAIGTLAGGIAHDFNNILFPIIGFTEMTMDDVAEGSAARTNLEEVLKAAKRARRLIHQILSFSRQTYQEKMPIQIQPVLKETLDFLRASLPSTIVIQQNIDKTNGTINADATQIHQVMMNLCTNAYQAMQESGGILEVTLKDVEISFDDLPPNLDLNPGKYLRLSVSDSGRGINPELIERIFDPYFSTKETGEGTGLGLSTVQGIVKNHGGYIIVDSKPEKGTTFHIYLPVFGITEITRPTNNSESTPKGTERILLVDDEEQNVRMAQQMLTTLGYDVEARTSSVEALELFRSKSKEFDLVITDQTMPNMTGIRLAQKLISIRPEIPIILCTGLSEMITEENAKIFGLKKCVIKPVLRSEMAKTIRQVLDQS